MRYLVMSLTVSFLFMCSCASIEGTRDKSYTYKRDGTSVDITNVVLLPIEETSKYPLVPELLEQNVTDELRIRFPNAKIVSSTELSYKLSKHHKLEEFSLWYASYRATKYLDFNKIESFTNDINAHYLLSIRSLNIDREKIHAVDSGYSGRVSDATNVYRTNLKFIGELIDVKNKKIIWQGIGFSENINSPKRATDLFFVIFNEKNPEVETFLNELVSVAASGFVYEMTKIKK